MSKQDYKPQYDLSSVVPYCLDAGVNIPLKFQEFIKNDDISRIAYWLDTCNKNKGAEFYGRKYEPYYELFIIAIETCLEYDKPEILDFLLYDNLNKYKNQLQWKKLEDSGYMILYCNAKNEDILFKALKNKMWCVLGDHDVSNLSESIVKKVCHYFMETEDYENLKDFRLALTFNDLNSEEKIKKRIVMLSESARTNLSIADSYIDVYKTKKKLNAQLQINSNSIKNIDNLNNLSNRNVNHKNKTPIKI